MVIRLQIFTYKSFFFLRFLDEFKTYKGLYPVARALGGSQNMRRCASYEATFELSSEKHESLKHLKQGDGISDSCFRNFSLAEGWKIYRWGTRLESGL